MMEVVGFQLSVISYDTLFFYSLDLTTALSDNIKDITNVFKHDLSCNPSYYDNLKFLCESTSHGQIFNLHSYFFKRFQYI